MNSVFVLLVFTLFIGNATAQSNQQLINWFAGADIVGTANSESELASDAIVREFEISANSNIDHIWEGTLTLSKHQEPGQTEDSPAEVHEAFVFSNSIIEQGHLKLGKFFLGVGRINRFHRHDWAFTNAPYYHDQFFGTEGVKDTGVEYSKLLSTERYINLTLGLTNGREFVHSHEHDTNFGFCLSLWDRIFGTYTSEPQDGHIDMKIGLSDQQDATTDSLSWSLKYPVK